MKNWFSRSLKIWIWKVNKSALWTTKRSQKWWNKIHLNSSTSEKFWPPIFFWKIDSADRKNPWCEISAKSEYWKVPKIFPQVDQIPISVTLNSEAFHPPLTFVIFIRSSWNLQGVSRKDRAGVLGGSRDNIYCLSDRTKAFGASCLTDSRFCHVTPPVHLLYPFLTSPASFSSIG